MRDGAGVSEPVRNPRYAGISKQSRRARGAWELAEATNSSGAGQLQGVTYYWFFGTADYDDDDVVKGEWFGYLAPISVRCVGGKAESRACGRGDDTLIVPCTYLPNAGGKAGCKPS